MAKYFQVFWLILTLTCGLVSVKADNIPVLEIPEQVIVPGPKIYLSDLGSIRNPSPAEGLDLTVDLGPAPYPGRVRVFSRDYLGLILKQKGFNQALDIQMGNQVEVRVESTCITAAELEAAIQKELSQDNPFIIRRWIELRNLPAETWLNKGEWQIKASPLGELPLVGTAIFRVTLTKDNEIKTINASGKLRALGRVYQATRDISRHSLINEAAFQLIETELTNGKEFLGKIPQDTRSTKLIQKGRILEINSMQSVPLVTKGNYVNVIVADGKVAIKMTGIAGKDGWLGDQIAIHNQTSKKVFQGRVIGPNLVEVNF
ncbi:MAG: flagellar basal body P-ring formation protein FlgA [Firmicutes bacterium]|nr:flagellar basal body P-ring formation protein FlgA [Bacillota bacterium]